MYNNIEEQMMETYYVLADKKMIVCHSLLEAQNKANECLEKPYRYIEYGVYNYDGWGGAAPIAVLRSEEIV